MLFKKNNMKALLSKERAEQISKECLEIRKEFNLNIEAVRRISKFYITNITIKTGDVYNNILYIKDILTSYGYTTEEINTFFNRNGRIYLADSVDLKRKLALFNSINLFEDAIFKANNYLTHEMRQIGFTINYLYGLTKVYPNMTLEELYFLKDIKFSNREEIISNNKLTTKEMFKLEYELNKYIKEIKKNNINKKTLK